MDNLDTIDNWDGGWIETVASGPSEQSEKQKEKASKALAWIQRTQKDESKSRKQSGILAKAIAVILQSGHQEAILPPLFLLLEKEIPAHIVLALVCISENSVLRFTTEELHYPNTFPTVTPRDVPVVFDAEHLHDSEKRYINQWIDFVFVLISEEVSVLATQKFIAQLKTGVRADIVQALSQFLSLFFFQLQITPTPAIRSYAKFIVEQMEKKLHQIYVTDIDTGEKVRL